MTSQVAQTILQQLGGSRFVAMTGAKNLVAGENRLQFSIGRNSSRANKVIVTLTADDLYTVEFGRYAKLDYTTLSRVEGLFAESLQSTFTRATGLDTHL